MAVLAAVATSAAVMKKRLGSARSARPRMALVKVPKTNPACTALVSIEACVALMANSALSDGTTAVAENQSAMAAT